jgi:hypothetical protein
MPQERTIYSGKGWANESAETGGNGMREAGALSDPSAFDPPRVQAPICQELAADASAGILPLSGLSPIHAIQTGGSRMPVPPRSTDPLEYLLRKCWRTSG